jgi:hypothetical protein
MESNAQSSSTLKRRITDYFGTKSGERPVQALKRRANERPSEPEKVSTISNNSFDSCF